MKNYLDFMSRMLHTKIVNSIIIVMLCFLIYRVISYLLSDKNKNLKLFTSNRSKTYLKMIKSMLRYIFIIITILILLQINGINVSSMLAGVGIASVIIGFAIQDLLKDIIKGLDIISDQYFQVGDVIKYHNMEGKVLAIGLKCTKLRDLRTTNIVSISNRNIEEVEVVADFIDVFVPLSYELKISKAENIINEILLELKKLKLVNNAEYKGVSKLDESSINYHIKVYCDSINKLQANRDTLRTILLSLEKNNINIPYKQIDIHNH